MPARGSQERTLAASALLERLLAFAAQIDGSLVDEQTWRRRHRWILVATWAMAALAAVFTVADPEHREQVAHAGLTLAFVAGASLPWLPRRSRELLVTLALMFEELYLLRYVGDFTLAPLAMVMLTFYQDWVPIAFDCALTLAMLLVAGVDPGYYHGARGLAMEVPHTGMTLRGAAIALEAGLALAVWRSGTQFARDQLTGMLSRVGAERALDHDLERGRRPAAWVCDIDNFGTVNQHLGPDAADQLLKHVAARLSRVARRQPGSWLCARLGGDTFMIVARNSPDEAAVELFAHGLEGEAALNATDPDGHDVPVHISIGAAVAVAGERGAGLIRAAERNMREAKGRGRRRAKFDQRIDRALHQTEPLLTAQLYRACDRGELVLHYQPIVRLDDGAPVGVEALVRWRHPDRGLMLPGEFLPEAENDSALVAVVARTVGNDFLGTAADLIGRHGSDWLSYGYAFNLSAGRLRDPLVVTMVNGALTAAGLANSDGVIHIEITEGALMDVEHSVGAVLAEFVRHGYRIDLDDFGTGHSSLAHLRDFPLHAVKIDRTFVSSMSRSPTDRAVVQAVADIASATGLTVVAEGVETEEQRDLLLAIKPDILAQGWLYAKAMPVEELEAWVLERKRAGVW